MDYQTKSMNGHAQESATATMVRGAREFSADLVSLAELQWELALADLAIAKQEALAQTIKFVMVAGLAIGGTPLLLFGVAELLVEQLAWSRGWTYLGVAVVALGLAGLVGRSVVQKLSQCGASFARSKFELNQNIAWLKKALTRKSEPTQPAARY
jgi:uncharacterized membrane protein YqjE